VKLVCGLGNPGARYAGTRHNAGFMAVEAFCDKLNPSWSEKWESRIARVEFQGVQILVQEPLTFMNLSGFALVRAAGFFRIAVDDVIVVHDDIDLPIGRVQVKFGGGDGGHKGIRSIIEQLGSGDFARIRVGVGRPAGRGPDVVDFVLQPFSADEEKELSEAIDVVSVAIREWVVGGVPKAQNKVNRRGNPKRGEPSCPPEMSDGPKDREEV